MDRKALLLSIVFVEGGLLLLGLILMRSSQLELWSRFDLTGWATVSALLFCVPILAMLFFVVRSRWAPLFHMRSEIDEKIIPIFANSRLPDLALMAFLAGVGEELFFRGWMQGLLTNKFGPWVGIVIVSLVFGLAHYLSSTYAIYASLIGLYLGIIYQVSGNLYLVMAIHAVYDFIALVFLGKNRRWDPDSGI